MQQRQGDVFIEKVSEVPEGAVPYPMEGKRFVLAHGEVTGHAHAIYETDTGIEMFEKEGVLYLKTTEEKVLKHEEHGPLTIPAGVYSSRIQREYHPEEIRNVMD